MTTNTSSVLGCSPSVDWTFGPIVKSCRDDFDFTIAFEQYFFVICPAAILLIIAPLRVQHLSKLPRVVAGTFLESSKIVIMVVFAILQLVLVILWANQSTELGALRTICIAAASVSFTASVVSCFLSYVEHQKSIRPSFILNAYLLVSLTFDGAILRTFWLARLVLRIRGVFIASFTLKAGILILEAVEKRRFIIQKTDRGSPETTGSLYNQGFLWWMNRLLVIGYRSILKPVDLYNLDREMSSEVVGERFWHSWNGGTSFTRSGRLVQICLKTLAWQLLSAVLARLFLLFFVLCQPLVLHQLLIFLENTTANSRKGYGLMAAYGLIYLGIAVSSVIYRHQTNRMLTMLRGMLMSAIFVQATKISVTGLDNAAAVTLMSTDVDVIVAAFTEIHEFWAGTIQIAIATWLLSDQIGFACIGPVIICIIALIASAALSPFSNKYMLIWVQKVQQRIGITSTMLGHMKGIKMSGLSQKLSNTISKLRLEEIQAASPFRIVMAISSGVSQIPQLISPVAAFAFFAIKALRSDETFDVTKIFVSLSLVILLSAPLFTLSQFVLELNAAIGCFSRIEKFLSTGSHTDYRRISGRVTQSEDTEKENGNHHVATNIEDPSLHSQEKVACTPTLTAESRGEKNIVKIRDASFSWSKEDATLVKTVNLVLKKGQMAMIVGPVASGKTTFLKGLLGEVPVATGEVKIIGNRVAWCEPSPWLTNTSIRNNIIGYSEYNSELYKQAVYACDLQTDFSQLQDGDETLVGSKGIALSGGQKQRIAIARTIYSRPDIAIFDDVFNGLDKQTAETVFARTFSDKGGLLSTWQTTVVFATHSGDFLPYADVILILDKGSVMEQGSFQELSKREGFTRTYSELRRDFGQDTKTFPVSVNDLPPKNAARTKKKQVEDARRQTGDFSIYKFFFRESVGLSLTIGLLACACTWAFLSTFPTVWLKWWSDSNSKRANGEIGYYLGGYTGFQIAAVLSFAALFWISIVVVAAKSGIRLHQVLLQTVMGAPLSLFTSTDVGSITTRFSQDIGILDRNLPLALCITLGDLFTAIAQAIVIAMASAYIAIGFPFLILVVYFLQRGYLRTSRQLRILDLEEKAPVYTQFLETLDGLVTIRAFSWGEHAIRKNYQLVDRAQQPFYLLLMAQQWLTLVLDLIVAALALFVVGLAVRLRGSVSVGLTGVSLIQLISFSETLKILIQFWTSLETSIGAVTRIKRFSEDTPAEGSADETRTNPSDWPGAGKVEFEGVSASYSNEGSSVNALNNTSLSISAGEKVAIVGRTGSGKSSLILTLLRMLDTSSGSIQVDGIDLHRISREEIRRGIIVITQDTFFLPGTVRRNIDPYETSDDQAIHEVLEKVGLKEVIDERGGLDEGFEEDMLSQGQKQLFALGRAILRKGSRRLVVMDEATSTVDYQTDFKIQQLIRDEFQEHTLISITHRQETIKEFDRVIVMENGRVVEIITPREFLGKE